jgi:hypothetical protein
MKTVIYQSIQNGYIEVRGEGFDGVVEVRKNEENGDFYWIWKSGDSETKTNLRFVSLEFVLKDVTELIKLKSKR